MTLGVRNTRMKDFFDLWVIAKTFTFDGAILAAAVAATFARRQTLFAAETPFALTEEFYADPRKNGQWNAFLERTAIAIPPAPFPELVTFIATFVSPLMEAKSPSTMAAMTWPRGGPWVAHQ